MTLAGQISAALMQEALAPQTEGLAGLLQRIATLIENLPGILGSLVAALDEEGTPLAVGECQLLENTDLALVETLLLVQEAVREKDRDGNWTEAWSVGSVPERKLALVIQEPSRRLGLIVVRVKNTGRLPTEVLNALSGNSPLFALVLKSSIAQEAWRRFEQLQYLAQMTLSREPWDFQSMVEQLSELFEAGAVTLLLEEDHELRLSASTSPHLTQSGPVIYQPGEGLTGHVFLVGQSVRLSSTNDRKEVFHVTGLYRSGPRFPEKDRQGFPSTQFLAVPLRLGKKVVGVLRMSRREGVARFTHQDENVLQFFADLLGAAVAPARDLLLARSMLESVTEAIAVSRRETDAEGRFLSRIIMANPGAESLLGRHRHEIEGLDASEIYDPVEYERIRQELRPARDAARREGHAEYGPILSKMKKADNILVPVTISYRFLANRLVQPPTLYTIALARETSKVELQAEQHQRLLALLGAMRIAYFQADLNGITQISTSADSETTGYSPEELQVIPRTMLYPDSATQGWLLKRARENHGHLPRVLVQMKHKNGELFWGEGDLRILTDPMGRETGSEGLYRDVTDRIRLQGFINVETDRVLTDSELFTKLVKDAELQLDYLSSLSHQLLTPLGSLIETLRNFERGEISQRLLQQRLPYVIGQTVVCTRLVRNLSYMDKILRDEPFNKGRVSFAKLAIETKWEFLHLLEERHLEIRINDESIDRYVPAQGNQEMLRQVLVNLVDNAIKYSLPNTTIIIRGRKWPEGNALEISNQGLPLSAEERERIFERGFRTRGAQAAVPHGTGLGLWLVRKIVEAHGATIRCLEVLEDGKKRNLFRILFPNLPAIRRS
jgi:PAS domain S-box-containing protein